MKYNQLTEEAKEKAKSNLINNLLEVVQYEDLKTNSNLKKAIDKANEMKTPWFTGSYVYEYCDKSLEKMLRESHNNYNIDGELSKLSA